VTVYLVGAGPGDPGLITRRGAELLARAEVVVYDRLVAPALLALAPPDALRVDVGKRPGVTTPQRQQGINELLVEHGRAGRAVVRLKGGDPFVFGRGGEEAMALRDAGIAFEVVPGVTSAFAAPAYAGVPVTYRGLSASVTVVTGNVGDPTAGGVDWGALARAGGTLVVLMGMERRAEIAARLIEGGRARDTPVLVVHQGSTPAQRRVRTTLAQLGSVELGPPSTIVVGAVAGLDLDWFSPGPLAGTTVVVTRARSQSAGLVDALTEAGASVVDMAVIDIAAPPDDGDALAGAADRLRAGAYDWVVCTSANAVEQLLSCLRDGRDLGRTRIAAVGPATAAALAAHHLVADLVPDDASAQGLADAMPAGTGRVLYPRAVAARPVLAAGLRAKGWDVDEVDAYRTVPASDALERGPEALERALQAVVTFTSPSTVRAFTELVGGRTPALVACIGPVTAEAARQAGLNVDVVADEHSAAGLVDALVAHLAGGAGPVPRPT
jgi:uroporphyrinogen III methyltransferase/synthase